MHFLSVVPTLEWHTCCCGLSVAAVLGGAIGMERELRERQAGLRRTSSCRVGSALFTLVSAYGFHEFS